ncbi:MAG: glycosyltransferase [Eubacterium sp.]
MKKKVLIVNDELQFGGSDLVAVRLEQYLDKDKFDCTYCVRHEEIGPLEPLLIERGVRIIHIPDNQLSYGKSYKFILNLLEKEHFDIIHSHLLFFSAIVLKAAKKKNVPVRVAHSHFSKPLYPEKGLKKILKNAYRFLMRIWLKRYATKMIACSVPAGEFLYGKKTFAKKGIVLNNGIDCSEYEFKKSVRESVRKEFNISDDAVLIGHIGQMWYAKNHDFLIDVFNEFHKINPNSYLMLVSNGPLREKIESKVESLNLKDAVIFTGFRTDCNELLMAMDCFVFPSIHEGFPLTLIEAQASKLSCLVSDAVNPATKLNSNFDFASLEGPVSEWVRKIDELLKIDRDSVDNSKVISEYDIKNISKKLEKIYLE